MAILDSFGRTIRTAGASVLSRARGVVTTAAMGVQTLFPQPAKGPLPSRADLAPSPPRTVHAQNPIPTLGYVSVDEVRAMVIDHEYGQFIQSALLADLMDRNPRIMSALNTRTLGVLGLPFHVIPGTGRKARKVAEAWEALWPYVAPEDVLADLLRWTVKLGVGLAEILWDTDSGQWIPRLKIWHPVWVYWRWDTWSYWVITQDAGLVEVKPGDGRWLLLSFSQDRGWMHGVIRCLALENEVRNYAIRDWARWCEKHGLPITKLKVPADQKSTQEVADFFAMMMSLGSEGTLVLPQAAPDSKAASFDADLMEPRDKGWEGFERLIERTETDVAIAVLGQNLTTEVTGGSYAAAKVHDRVRADYMEADAALLATAIWSQVTAPWALWNYGDARLAPWSVYDATPPDDLAAEAKMLSDAGNAWSLFTSATIPLQLDPADFASRFRLRLAAPSAPTPTTPVPTTPATDPTDPVPSAPNTAPSTAPSVVQPAHRLSVALSGGARLDVEADGPIRIPAHSALARKIRQTRTLQVRDLATLDTDADID